MSIVAIQPGIAELSDPNAGNGGWAYGYPTSSGVYGIPAISGLRSNAMSLFGDSPPIDGETYLVTTFNVGYGAVLHAANEITPDEIQVEFALLVGPDIMYREIDAQPPTLNIDEGLDFTSTGVFSADLINPIAVTSSDRLSMRVGLLSIGDGGNVALGVQLVSDPTDISVTAYPSILSYTLIRPRS